MRLIHSIELIYDSTFCPAYFFVGFKANTTIVCSFKSQTISIFINQYIGYNKKAKTLCKVK